MPDDVDQRVALLRIVHRRPVSDVLHAMFLEELRSVLAKAREQVRQFPWRSVVDPEFVDARRARAVGFVKPGVSPK